MFKRAIGILLAALLLALPMASALAAPGDLTLFEAENGTQNEAVDSAAALGDTLYLRGNNNVYSWKPGQDAPELFFDGETAREDGPQLGETRGLFVVDDRLMTLDPEAGALREVTGNALIPTDYKVDMGMLPGATGDPGSDSFLIDGMQMIGGRLLLMARPDENNWEKNQILSVDLGTGKITALTDTISRITLMAPYKEGKALIGVSGLYGGMVTIEDGKSYFEFRVLDLQSGQFEGEPYSPFTGFVTPGTIAYDAGGDMLYFTGGNRVYRARFGEEPEVVNYLQREVNSNNGAALMLGGRLVIPGYNGTVVCSVDPAEMPKSVLKVMGDWYTQELMPGFVRENPDIAVDRIDESVWNAESVANMIQGGQAADVYAFYTYNPIAELIDKGYALDLSGEQALVDAVNSFYPQVRDAVIKDGKLYGFPIQLSAQFWAYNEEAFDECGLQFPETMSDFMDLLVEWDDIQDDYPDKVLMDFYSSNVKEMLFSMILSAYVVNYAEDGKPLSFDHPAFREPMQKLESLPYEFDADSSRDAGGSSVVVVSSFDSREYIEPMLNAYASLANYYSNQKALMLPPRLNADAEQFAEGTLTMLIVNPYSENKESALAYLRYVAAHMSAENRIAMDPDYNEPVENSWFRQTQEYNEKALKELMEQQVEPENQREHDAEVERAQRELVENEKNNRYLVSADRIEAYRRYATQIRMTGESSAYAMLNSNSEEFVSIVNRYMQGQLSLDQMVRELDQKMQMIYLETR